MEEKKKKKDIFCILLICFSFVFLFSSEGVSYTQKGKKMRKKKVGKENVESQVIWGGVRPPVSGWHFYLEEKETRSKPRKKESTKEKKETRRKKQEEKKKKEDRKREKCMSDPSCVLPIHQVRNWKEFRKMYERALGNAAFNPSPENLKVFLEYHAELQRKVVIFSSIFPHLPYPQFPFSPFVDLPSTSSSDEEKLLGLGLEGEGWSPFEPHWLINEKIYKRRENIRKKTRDLFWSLNPKFFCYYSDVTIQREIEKMLRRFPFGISECTLVLPPRPIKTDLFPADPYPLLVVVELDSLAEKLNSKTKEVKQSDKKGNEPIASIQKTGKRRYRIPFSSFIILSGEKFDEKIAYTISLLKQIEINQP